MSILGTQALVDVPLTVRVEALENSGVDTVARNRLTVLEDKYVRTTRFASVIADSGTLTPATGAEIVLNDFGGGVSAIVCGLSSGYPDYSPVYTSAGDLITTSFNSSAEYVLSGTPAFTPVAIVYRIQQKDIDFDSEGSDIIGPRMNDYCACASYGTGVVSNPTITVAVNGTTLDVTSVDAYLYSAAGWTGIYKKYTIPAGDDLSITDNSVNYLVVDYNSGSPIYKVITNPALINSSTVALVANMYREGTEVHYIQANFAAAPAERIINRLINTNRFERSSGLTLSEEATRVIKISSGVVWYGSNNISESEVISSSSNAVLYYLTGGSTWNKSIISAYNNTQYNDTATGLATLSNNNKYTNNWIYRFIDGTSLPKIAVVLGTAEYSSPAEAVSAGLPSVPTILQRQAILVGRITVKKSVDTAEDIKGAFETEFVGEAISNHNSLSSLQGGTTNEYYHLTSSQHGIVTGVTSTASSAGTLTLTAASNGVQIITGVTTHSVVLPAATNVLRFTIKNYSTGNITVSRAGSDTIDGSTSIVLSYKQAVTLCSDGVSLWVIV